MAYADSGQGPVILLVHGWAASGRFLDPLAEALQGFDGALAGGAAQPALGVQPVGQLHHLAQAIDDHRLSALGAGDDHVEAVRAEIDGGDVFGKMTQQRHSTTCN